MTNRSRIFVTVGLAVAAVWIFFTPYLAVRGMKSAAVARDAAKLGDYVNFPALKESLKGSLNAKLASTVSKDVSGNQFGALGAAIASAMLSPMIDALVTPESLALLMKGDKPVAGRGADNSNTNDADVDVSMSYETVDRFVVTARKKGDSGEPVGLVFLRDGLFSWKLSAIRLPD
jgi:Protein of unknown function (DUF2939)